MSHSQRGDERKEGVWIRKAFGKTSYTRLDSPHVFSGNPGG